MLCHARHQLASLRLYSWSWPASFSAWRLRETTVRRCRGVGWGGAEQRTASLRSGRDLQTEGPPCQKVQTTRSGSAPQGTARNTGEKSATVTGGA